MALYKNNKNTKDFEKEIEPKKPKKKGKGLNLAWIKDERTHKVVGFTMVIFSVFTALAMVSFLFTWKADQNIVTDSSWELFTQANPDAANNWMGILGAMIAHTFMYKWFGIASFGIVLLIFLLGIKVLFKWELLPIAKTAKYAFISIIWLSVLLGFIFSSSYNVLGGAFGYQMYQWLKGLMGNIGTVLFLLTYLVIFLIVVFNFDLFKKRLVPAMEEAGSIAELDDELSEEAKNKEEEEEPLDEDDFKLVVKDEHEEESPFKDEEEASTPTIDLSTETKKEATIDPLKEGDLELVVEESDDDEVADGDEVRGDLSTPYDPTLELSNYKFPTLDLLKDYGNTKQKVDPAELENSKNMIVETLKNYNIEISQIKATIGPTVTLYEIVPAKGVKISKIKNLEDDIALSLAALGIRIIAPIPGKGTIGIEVPNKNPELVPMKMAIASSKFVNSDYELPVILGKTISNEVFVADLARMPHLLMAGATGQGKSVGLNALLVSLLYKKHPSQVKFVLVDPKKVELTLFRAIERHFLAKLPGDGEAIITDNKLVINTLNSLCIEMDKRYELLQDALVRNIKEYNAKFIKRKLNPTDGHRFLPYIVVVIDEVADLIMTAGKEVEHPIGRIAQLARAVGIHLVLATQRPSVNIITGTIKANFPARIAFRVTSKIDSRTILDSGGADQLIGKGDLLYSTGNELLRLQCPFVDTPEVEEITNFIGNQQGYGSPYILPEYKEDNGGGNDDFDASDRDALFEDAARIVVLHQQGSTSLVQRRLKVGYNRAGRLIDQLEQANIVGPFEGSKARDVLVADEMALEQLLKDIDEKGN